jgi:hypothetical protein
MYSMDRKIPIVALFVLGVFLAVFLFQGFFFDSSLGVVSSVDVMPKNPVQGDVVTVTVTATPNKSVPVSVDFSTNLTIINGGYEILLEGLKVPDPPNSFTVSASGVQDLNISVKFGVWLTKSATASGGVATILQDGVPAGSYDVRIFGGASPGVSEVGIKVVAASKVVIGSDGIYTYNYDTAVIPVSSLKVVAGEVTRTIILLPRSVG